MKVSNVRDAITGISYLIKVALTAMWTPGLDNEELYINGCVVTTKQAIIDVAMYEKLESVNVVTGLFQTLDGTLSLSLYLVKMT